MSGVAPVALCLIVKDEAEVLERCLASVRSFVAEVNVYDTGSTDGTLELLERLVAEPGPPLRVEWGEWRDDFAWARAQSQSFAMASPELDWLLQLDADDELIGGSRLAELVEEVERAGLPAARLAYQARPPTWAASMDIVREFGLAHLPLDTFRTMLVRRGSGGWEGIVHEDWRLLGADQEVPALVRPAYLRVEHRRDAGRPGHYVPLLRKAVRDTQRTPRAYLYLGAELEAVDDRAGAVEAWRSYLLREDDAIEGRWNKWRNYALCGLIKATADLGRPEALQLVSSYRDYLRGWYEAFEAGWAHSPDRMEAINRLATDRSHADPGLSLLIEPELPAGRPLLETVEQTIASLWNGSARPGRNVPCPCGSGKKSKRCCYV